MKIKLIKQKTKIAKRKYLEKEEQIIMQKEIDINPNENAGNLHDRLMTSGSELVVDTVKAIEENSLKTKTQPSRTKQSPVILDKSNN